MADPSNAGPYEVGLTGSLAAGESRSIRFSEVEAGPRNRVGYLAKVYGAVGGMDFVFIVNTSAELISVATRGGRTFIPPATSQTLDSGPFRSVTVTNEGSNPINTGSSDKVAVETGNGPRTADESQAFSVRRAINDVVPGANL